MENFLSIALYNPIFDTKQGVIFYMPILLIAFLGLFLYRKRFKLFGNIFITIFLLNFLLISSYDAWNAAGYTIRYFVSSLPILVFGLAEVVLYLRKKFTYQFIYLVSGSFIAHQFLAIAAFKLFWQDPTYVGAQLSRSGQFKIFILQTLEQVFSSFLINYFHFQNASSATTKSTTPIIL